MTHLLDSNAVYDLLSDATLLDAVPPNAELHVSAVTVLELQFGIAKAAHDGDAQKVTLRQATLAQVSGLFDPEPIDGAVQAVFGRISAAALTAGQNPRKRMNDLMVAATALANGWTLVTADEQLIAAVGPILDTLNHRP
ncbi:PIN domain-containing protein [Kineococcus sp. TBRC 1896]|uniref:Ribonuclease VapC n=1 Tax=Kineococcus mangrovi TaxID=1660183 RepID=A0ABV4I8E2_9ACTN